MIKIFSGIRAGKTYRMVQSFRENDDTILVVMHDQEKRRIVGQYNLSKHEQDRVFLFSDIGDRMRGIRQKRVLIDNADALIRSLFPGQNVTGISMTAVEK